MRHTDYYGDALPYRWGKYAFDGGRYSNSDRHSNCEFHEYTIRYTHTDSHLHTRFCYTDDRPMRAANQYAYTTEYGNTLCNSALYHGDTHLDRNRDSHGNRDGHANVPTSNSHANGHIGTRTTDTYTNSDGYTMHPATMSHLHDNANTTIYTIQY